MGQAAGALIMKRKFFTRVGWFYAPVSLGGFIVTFLAIVFGVTAFLAIDPAFALGK